ncbi:hypothetical protein D3C81_2172770 [compost metagenome]
MNPLDNRRDALELLKRRNRPGTGSSRLAPHINQGGASSNHRLSMFQGSIELTETTAIGEGIGSDIENAHDMRMGQIKNPAAARQPD